VIRMRGYVILDYVSVRPSISGTAVSGSRKDIFVASEKIMLFNI
jgi:hypothetical protein